MLGAHLAGHLVVQRVQVGGGLVAGLFEPLQFRQHVVLGQPTSGRIHEDLVDAVRSADGHSRRNADTLAHAWNLTAAGHGYNDWGGTP